MLRVVHHGAWNQIVCEANAGMRGQLGGSSTPFQ